MIPPQAAAKADIGSRKTDRAGTCARRLKIVETAACGQDRLQDKGLCKSPIVVREE